jgi:hypothetical protein
MTLGQIIGDAMVERFVIRAGTDVFDVIEGRQLNDKPLNRSEADRLAGNKSVAKKGGSSKRPPMPMPAPAASAVDLQPTGWDHAGGSVGFRIRGALSW